jgi:hypothetical protein
VVATLLTSSCGLPLTALTSYQTPQMGGGYSWITLPLAVSGLDPHSNLCLQIQGASASNTAVVESEGASLLSSPSACYLLTTTNGGSSWQETQNQSLLYYVYGTYTTANAPSSQIVLTGIRCTLQAGTDPATQVVSSIPVYNQPVLP